MPHQVAKTEVFRRHALTGFVPSVPHIRYPVTIGLYEEGMNLGLFLAPIDLTLARMLTGIADTDQALSTVQVLGLIRDARASASAHAGDPGAGLGRGCLTWIEAVDPLSGSHITILR